MTPEQSFLAAITAAPDDDVPRLIFADWLEERGQGERAEFIRAQCELAGPYDKVKPSVVLRHDYLRSRERDLLDVTAHWSGWTHQAFDHLAYDVGVATDGDKQHVTFYDERRNELGDFWCYFRRGFVEEIELRIDEWLGRGRELRAAAPLRTVRLTCEPATLANSVNQSFAWAMHNALVRLAQDDEPGDNPVCGLDTLDLSRLTMERWDLSRALQHAFRPWRGLRCLILPNWTNLEERYRPYEIEQWKKRVPSLQSVQFGSSAPTEEVTA